MSSIPINQTVKKPGSPETELSEIRRLKALLDYLGILNDYIPPDDKTNFEQLYLTFLNKDRTTGKFMIILAFLNDVVNLNDLDPENITYNLQFYVPIGMDTKVDQNNIVQLITLLTRFNNFLPLGLFSLSPENNVYFRYTLPSKEKKLNNHLFVETIEMIEYYLNIFALNILDFLEGRKTFEQALEDGVNGLVKVENR